MFFVKIGKWAERRGQNAEGREQKLFVKFGRQIKKGPIDMGPVPKLTAYEKTYSIHYIRLRPEQKGFVRTC